MNRLLIYFIVIACINFTCCKQNNPILSNHIFVDTVYLRSFGETVGVPVTIKGKKLWFLVDTGARSSINRDLYYELNFDSVGYEHAIDLYGNRDSLLITNVNNFQFSNKLYKNLKMGVLDLNNSSYNYLGFDGLLGSDILSDYVIQINLREKFMIVADNISIFDLDNCYKSKIRLSKNQNLPLILTKFYIDKDNFTLELLFDSGSDSFIKISNSLLNEATVHFQKEVQVDTMSNIIYESAFGTSLSNRQLTVKFDSIIISGFKFVDSEPIFMNSPFSILGSDIFAYGIVTLDYLNKLN